MLNPNFTRRVRIWNKNGNTYEIRTTTSGVFWGIFENGQKMTDFMNSQTSCAPALIRDFVMDKKIAWENIGTTGL